MKYLKKIRTWIGAHPKATACIGAVIAIHVGLSGLEKQAKAEADARKSPDVLAFEKAPATWLEKPVTVEQFRQELEKQHIAALALVNEAPGLALYTAKDGKRAAVTVPGCSTLSCSGTLLEKLNERAAADKFKIVRVDIDLRTPAEKLLGFLNSIIRTVITFGTILMVLMLYTRMTMGNTKGNGASMLTKQPDIAFANVIGNAEAKSALQRVLSFIRDPKKYTAVGAKAPRGVLMVGPPGTGKTLLAKALAGESKANFISVDGSYFTATYYGMGVKKVQDLFKLARANAPCVLFIDEIDGIGRRMSSGGLSGGESETNRIINRVLVEMDGFSDMDGVIVVGATNHETNLDEAMRRPGRFDMVVRLTLPTLPERKELFELYLGKIKRAQSLDVAALARMTAGSSPADIANLVNKAASTAAEQLAEQVTQEHMERAIETHQLGGEVSPIKGLLTQETRSRLAFHESGHAIVAHALGMQVERVTIEPRGAALGVTYITRASEDPLHKESELANRIAMMLAGREAELLELKSVSTGASDDLKRASALAVEMVSSLGFSKAFGLLSVHGVPQNLLGPDVQAAVLQEARRLLDESQRQARVLLETNREVLGRMTAALLETEVLSGEPLKEFLVQVATDRLAKAA
jgi:cell division protease FtsH